MLQERESVYQRHQEVLNEQRQSKADFLKHQTQLRDETARKAAEQRQKEAEAARQAEIERLKKEEAERKAEAERLRLIQEELERKRKAYRSLLQHNILGQLEEQQHQLELTNRTIEDTAQALQQAQQNGDTVQAKRLNAEYFVLRRNLGYYSIKNNC